MQESVLIFRKKYYYERDGSQVELQRSSLTPSLLPDDKILVNVKGEAVSLLGRQPQHAIAIVRGFNNGLCYFICPLLSPLYNPCAKAESLRIGDRVLVYITATEFTIITEYGSMHDRSKDWQIIDDLYSTAVAPPKRITHQDCPLYTQPEKDQCDLQTFTIDPEGSRDFDDAISIVGNTVFIHIVDIHKHIDQDTPIDIEAARQAFTLYLPEGNHNIIPREKAENEWSLIAGQPRAVITIEIRFTAHDVKSYDIYKSTVIVKNRYTYENAPHMPFLAELAAARKCNNFTIPFVKLNMDMTGNLLDTQHIYNTDESHRVIETLMILGNMLVSLHLEKYASNYIHIPQRFHTRLRDLPDTPPTGDIVIDSFLAIKSFALATYESEKKGHFGLNLQSYTHFTSPIRRYFDVIMHRMLGGVVYEPESLSRLLTHINTRERHIDALVQLHKDWKLYSKIAKGDIWDVIVTRVCSAGIYYLHKTYMIDGFIHVSKLCGKRWSFAGGVLIEQAGEGASHAQDGAYNSTTDQQCISLGTALRCRVEKVDVASRTLILAT